MELEKLKVVPKKALDRLLRLSWENYCRKKHFLSSTYSDFKCGESLIDKLSKAFLGYFLPKVLALESLKLTISFLQRSAVHSQLSISR